MDREALKLKSKEYLNNLSLNFNQINYLFLYDLKLYESYAAKFSYLHQEILKVLVSVLSINLLKLINQFITNYSII